MDDESIATVTNPDGNTPEEILAAAQSCPVDAIILTDAATGEKVWPQGCLGAFHGRRAPLAVCSGQVAAPAGFSFAPRTEA